jgi:hypothetical protein
LFGDNRSFILGVVGPKYQYASNDDQSQNPYNGKANDNDENAGWR